MQCKTQPKPALDAANLPQIIAPQTMRIAHCAGLVMSGTIPYDMDLIPFQKKKKKNLSCFFFATLQRQL